MKTVNNPLFKGMQDKALSKSLMGKVLGGDYSQTTGDNQCTNWSGPDCTDAESGTSQADGHKTTVEADGVSG